MVIPRSASQVTSCIGLSSHSNGGACIVSSSNIVVARGLTGALNISINSAIAFGADRANATARPMGITKVIRGCVCRCVCVAPGMCGRLFGRATSLGAVFVGASNAISSRALSGRLVSLDTVGSIAVGDAARGRVDSIVGDLLFVIMVLVITTKLLTFIILCGLGGVGVARHEHRLTALGILNFCGGRLTFCICHRGVMLAVFNIVFNVILNVVLRTCIVDAVRASCVVFNGRVATLDCLTDVLLAILFATVIGFIVCFELGGVSVIRSLGDTRWAFLVCVLACVLYNSVVTPRCVNTIRLARDPFKRTNWATKRHNMWGTSHLNDLFFKNYPFVLWFVCMCVPQNVYREGVTGKIFGDIKELWSQQVRQGDGHR